MAAQFDIDNDGIGEFKFHFEAGALRLAAPAGSVSFMEFADAAGRLARGLGFGGPCRAAACGSGAVGFASPPGSPGAAGEEVDPSASAPVRGCALEQEPLPSETPCQAELPTIPANPVFACGDDGGSGAHQGYGREGAPPGGNGGSALRTDPPAAWPGEEHEAASDPGETTAPHGHEVRPFESPRRDSGIQASEATEPEPPPTEETDDHPGIDASSDVSGEG
mmetsp:Transcript_98855/g.308023  ORF Transcript_98855/g.308023 Transcript_98855/m.308023 type:complete len:222 (+) Transcript_98855:91-756(+)